MNKALIFLFLSLSINLFSQEKIIWAVSKNPYASAKNIEETDTLNLPFFDDFSSAQINPNLWDNSGVTVSFYGPQLPPSLGAAMFDAVDQNGNFYAKNYAEQTPSDTLTSKPINLFFPNDNTIYLSFYYEPQGNMDMPEPKDSLVLQFYSPLTKHWYSVWRDTGQVGQLPKVRFKLVMLHITDYKFLQKGFKFRFLNYTSLGSETYRSLVSNCDQWFVDYIYLNRNRYSGDTTYRDVALQYPLTLKIGNYTAVPFSHYNANQKLNLLLNLRNNDILSRTIDSLYLIFNAKSNSPDTLFLGSYSFPPYGNYFIKKQNIPYKIPISHPANINIQTKLITDQYDPKQNNYSFSQLNLTNFYAYDDGTAEAGYGLFGDGTYQAKVAAKFYTNKPDTLTAVQIYFNKTYKGFQPHYFYLMVWNNNPSTGLPDQLIYSQTGVEINFNQLNSFQTFRLDTPVIVSDTFYIGWMKTDEQLMNVGLDLDNVTENYKFYNIDGTWQHSQLPGNLMIRPVFGSSQTISRINNSLQNQLTVYPTLLHQGPLHIIYPQHFNYQIINLQGQIKITGKAFSNCSLDLSDLPPGVYILRLSDQKGHYFIRKFVKF